MDLDWLIGRWRRSRSRGPRGVRGPRTGTRSSHSETEIWHQRPHPEPGAALGGPPPRPLVAPPPPPVSAPPIPPIQAPGWAPPPNPATSISGKPLADRDATRIIGPRGAVVAVLIGVEGKVEGEVYKVRDGDNRLGRLQGAEISIGARDDTVSREHAIIIHREGTFGLKSLKKENPTWVNGDEVEVDRGTKLSDGDRIKVGQSTFRFRIA